MQFGRITSAPGHPARRRTTRDSMTDAEIIATRYVACWNERDPERRRDLLAALWTEDGTYLDPLMRAENRDGVGALIEGVQARFADFRFALTGSADGHAD